MNSKYTQRSFTRNILINAVLFIGSLLAAVFLLEVVFAVINRNIPEQTEQTIPVTGKEARFVGHEVYNE